MMGEVAPLPRGITAATARERGYASVMGAQGPASPSVMGAQGPASFPWALRPTVDATHPRPTLGLLTMHAQRARHRDYEALGLVLGLFAILFVLSLTLGTPVP